MVETTKQVLDKPHAVEPPVFTMANRASECSKPDDPTEFTGNHKLEIDIRDDQGLVQWDNRDSDQGIFAKVLPCSRTSERPIYSDRN